MTQQKAFPPPRIAIPNETILVAPTDSIVRLALAALRKLTTPAETPARHSYLNFSSLFHATTFSILGPVVGAPAAALALEPLLAAGVERILLIGACGGLSFGECYPAIGQILAPRMSFSEEGTSRLYGISEGKRPCQLSELQLALEHVIAEELTLNQEFPTRELQSGGIWTTDAPFCETVDKCRDYWRQGAIGVEMEYAAMLTVSQLYDAQLGALFVVSDLRGEKCELGFSKPEFRRSLRTAVESAISVLI